MQFQQNMATSNLKLLGALVKRDGSPENITPAVARLLADLLFPISCPKASVETRTPNLAIIRS